MTVWLAYYPLATVIVEIKSWTVRVWIVGGPSICLFVRFNLTIACGLHLYMQLIKTEYPECENSACWWLYRVQQNIVCIIDDALSFKFYMSFVTQLWYCYDISIYISNYWLLLSAVVQVYVQRVGIFGAWTIEAFDATYYLANHGSLERSVNLVLQGFIHRHTHFRMHIVFSLHCIAFAYIEENCASIRTENTLALLIPNHFVLDDYPRESGILTHYLPL